MSTRDLTISYAPSLAMAGGVQLIVVPVSQPSSAISGASPSHSQSSLARVLDTWLNVTRERTEEVTPRTARVSNRGALAPFEFDLLEREVFRVIFLELLFELENQLRARRSARQEQSVNGLSK